MSHDDDTPPEPRSNTELISRFPKLADPVEAIRFALDGPCDSPVQVYDFLNTWRDGGWSEIEEAYPEFLEQVDGK